MNVLDQAGSASGRKELEKTIISDVSLERYLESSFDLDEDGAVMDAADPEAEGRSLGLGEEETDEEKRGEED